MQSCLLILGTMWCLMSSKDDMKSDILCVCLENGYSVMRLKGRVKAARDQTKDLLRAVNGTMETLIAIPNGTV